MDRGTGLLAAAAGYGTYLLYTAVALGWTGVAVGPRRGRGDRRPRRRAMGAMRALGLGPPPRELVGAMAAVAAIGGALGFAVFASPLPAIASAAFAATFPPAAVAARRADERAAAQEAWPRLIEEIRLQTGSLGRSIPHALFDVGARAPLALRPAFEAAHREWLMSTDFATTTAVLKAGLEDPTADATCETLLVAHEVGGTDIGRRLEALVDDRIQDVQGRKDARARQAGVRFARSFVLVVPFGMAVAGLSIGDGRAAYRTPFGQLAAAAGVGLVGACWLWAGRVMRLPVDERVFGS